MCETKITFHELIITQIYSMYSQPYHNNQTSDLIQMNNWNRDNILQKHIKNHHLYRESNQNLFESSINLKFGNLNLHFIVIIFFSWAWENGGWIRWVNAVKIKENSFGYLWDPNDILWANHNTKNHFFVSKILFPKYGNGFFIVQELQSNNFIHNLKNNL